MDETRICYNCFCELTETDGTCPNCGYDLNQELIDLSALPLGYKLCRESQEYIEEYIIGRYFKSDFYSKTYLALNKQTGKKVIIREYFPSLGCRCKEKDTYEVNASSPLSESDFENGKKNFLQTAGGMWTAGLWYFEKNNTVYTVENYIEGISLQRYINKQGGKITWKDAYEKLSPIIYTLDHIHENGVLHRNLSLNNIFIESNSDHSFDNVKLLMNFKIDEIPVVKEWFKGFQLIEPYEPYEEYTSTLKVGPYTDVYAWCVCFYKAVTGVLPPDFTKRMESDQIKSFSDLGIDVPKAIEKIIFKGLELLPQNRYEYMTYLLWDFEQAMKSCTVSEDTIDKNTTSSGNIEQNVICYNCFCEYTEFEGACPNCGYDPAWDAETFPLALPHGYVLGDKYILGRVLGQGGYGITYLAMDKWLGTKVAVKEYFLESGAIRTSNTCCVTASSIQKQEEYQKGKEDFLQEARTLATLAGNPNIVHIHGYFEENNTAYFAMDYVQGITFKKYILNQGGKIPWKEAYEKLLPIISALEEVHQKGIIHRDISADNIYISSDGTMKLLDFGAARVHSLEKSQSLDVILKEGYAPYEQYMRRGKQGPFTDVYALCACFYMAVTSFLPPDAPERKDADHIASFSAMGVQIPADVERVIFKGLAVNAQDRYQNMTELRRALEQAVISSTAPPSPKPPIPPKSDLLSKVKERWNSNRLFGN